MEDTSVLIQRMRAGDTKAREVLIGENYGLVRHVIKRFAGRGISDEELFQIGVIGLIKAVDRFDANLGTMFSTYAVPMILGEIRRFLRDNGPIKVSRGIQENAWKIGREREELERRLGREPRVSELAETTGLSREEVVLAMEAREGVLSLHGGMEGEEGETVPLMDRICADEGFGKAVTNSQGRDAEKEKLLDRMLVRDLMDALPMDERRLLWLRFFQGKTQAEVSERLCISQVQVCRREKRILEKLRGKMDG